MATRDWASLGWSPTLNFALPNERQLAQSYIPDAGKGAEFKFNPTAMNASLLSSLGYTGQGLGSTTPDEFGNSGPQWSDDARTWLANNGYTVGVAHDPNTSAGGRPEYYGLVDKNGNFVAGQDDPTMTMSDTLMEQITPFLMMAGPFLNATGVIGAAAPGAGAVGSVSAPASSFTGDLISSAINGFGGGVGSAGIGSVGSALAPLASAGAGLAGLSGMSSADISNAITQGFGQGASNAVGSAVGNTVSNAVMPAIGAGAATSGGSSPGGSSVKNAMYGNEGYGPGMSGAQTSAYDSVLNATGSKGIADMVANSSLGSSVIDGIKGITDLVGGANNLGGLLGAVGGALSSQSGTQTTSRDPWAAAQPFLKGLLGDADAMRSNLRAQPYTPQQTQQYQNAYDGLAQARAAMPGLLGWGQQAMQRQSTVPSYADLFGLVKPK